MVLPKEWKSHHKPVCLQLAGTSDHVCIIYLLSPTKNMSKYKNLYTHYNVVEKDKNLFVYNWQELVILYLLSPFPPNTHTLTDVCIVSTVHTKNIIQVLYLELDIHYRT